MANDSTLEHSKTLGKQQFQNFSTLASTLIPLRLRDASPLPLEGKGLQVHDLVPPERDLDHRMFEQTPEPPTRGAFRGGCHGR